MDLGVPLNRAEYHGRSVVPTGMQETGIPPFVMAYGVIVAFLLLAALLG
jgi:hypothetical protein